MAKDESYERAKKRVKEIRDFYSHLSVYIVINVMLFLMNLFYSPGYPWFIWPLGVWGFFVIMHGFSALGRMEIFGSEWEEKKIKEIVAEEKKAKIKKRKKRKIKK